MSKLVKRDKRIKELWATGKPTLKQLGEKYGLSLSRIGQIVKDTKRGKKFTLTIQGKDADNNKWKGTWRITAKQANIIARWLVETDEDFIKWRDDARTRSNHHV